MQMVQGYATKQFWPFSPWFMYTPSTLASYLI
jgi:hypothetical protein